MATPLALSLRLTRCERTSQSNSKQTIQSTTRSHLVKSSYRSFVFEIHSTYVEEPNPNVSSIDRFAPSLEYTKPGSYDVTTAAYMVSPPEDLDQRTRNSSSNLRHRKRRSGNKKAGGETRQNELTGSDDWTHPRRPDDGSSTNSRRRRS